MERLGQKSLDLSCTAHGQLIFLRQLFHAEDGNDILKFFVFLEHLLNFSGCLIMLLSYDLHFQNTGGGL